MQTNLTFKILTSNSERSKAAALCDQIWHRPATQKELEEEENHIRIAVFFEGNICATVSLAREDDKFFMQKLVVKSDLQSKGIGSQLLKFCEEFALENEVRVIYCHAKDSFGRSAVNFLVKNEYFCGEEEFVEDGFPHKILWKILE